MTARPRHYAKPSAARSHNQRAMIFRPWKKSLLARQRGTPGMWGPKGCIPHTNEFRC